MSELIRKQDAVDAAIKADMENHNGILSEKRARVLEEHIAILPPVQPRRGKWLLDHRCGGGFWVCSSCKYSTEALLAYAIYNFCPNCGADMRGEQE